jgi:membrane-associated phospholipid phosphatase
MTQKKIFQRSNLTLLYALLLLLSSVLLPANAQEATYQLRRNLDIPLFGTGAAGSLAGLLWRTRREPLAIIELNALQINDVWEPDRSATRNYSRGARRTSDLLVASSYMLPLALLAFKDIRPDAGTLGVILVETILINEALTGLTKAAVQRARPYTYRQQLPTEVRTAPDNAFSFFSGHTSHAAAVSFFAAQVISTYTNRLWVRTVAWSGAALLPAATGFYRYRAGQHFPTDVMVGYVVGAAVGTLVPLSHRVERLSVKPGGSTEQGTLTLPVQEILCVAWTLP